MKNKQASRGTVNQHHSVTQAKFWKKKMEKNFWGQKKFVWGGKKFCFFEKKIQKKFWKKFRKKMFSIYFSIFSILWSHILTPIDFLRQNHYPII